MIVLIVIGYVANAEHDHHKKHGDAKKHESHGSKKASVGKPHKKAEIDFSSSEFTDSDAADETPDDEESQKGIQLKMMVYILLVGA